jgi:hypothetical protein
VIGVSLVALFLPPFAWLLTIVHLSIAAKCTTHAVSLFTLVYVKHILLRF